MELQTKSFGHAGSPDKPAEALAGREPEAALISSCPFLKQIFPFQFFGYPVRLWRLDEVYASNVCYSLLAGQGIMSSGADHLGAFRASSSEVHSALLARLNRNANPCRFLDLV
jgi:hypothetical protein